MIKKRNKGLAARHYCNAYKQLIRQLSPEDKKAVLDRTNNGSVSQTFVKDVIALAEQDDK